MKISLFCTGRLAQKVETQHFTDLKTTSTLMSVLNKKKICGRCASLFSLCKGKKEQDKFHITCFHELQELKPT